METGEALDEFSSHLKKSLRGRLRERAARQALDRGQFIFFEGDEADALYLLESGVIEANIIHGDGKVYIFQFVFPGDVLGEGVLYDFPTYPFSAVVRKDAAFWRIPKDDLLPLVESDPAFQNHLLGIVGRKLQHSYIKSRCIAGEKVERRVACILLKSMDEQGIFPDCTERLDTPLTNRDISGLIGSTEETVSRIMSRLKKEGVIAIKDKQLVVLDKAALMKYSDSM